MRVPINNEQFEAEAASNRKAIKRLERRLDAALDGRDTAQREALAQLAEAVDVLQSIRRDLTDSGSISEVDAFLARHAQAEQKEGVLTALGATEEC